MSSLPSNTRLTHSAHLMHDSWGSNASVPSNWRLSATGSNGGLAWTPESVSASGHTLLSLTHTDTLPASVSRGDMVAAASNATWKRMPTPSADAYTSDRFLGTINSDPHWRTRYYGVDRLTSSASNTFTGQVDLRGDGIGISVSSNTITLVNLGGSQGPPGSGGGFTLITDSLLGSDTASFDFTSIPGTYKHLRLVISGRSSRAGNTSDFVKMTFNNDTGSNYDWVFNQSGATTGPPGGSAEGLGDVAITDFMLIPADSSPTSEAGGGTIDIPDYASATFFKTVTHIGYLRLTTGSGNVRTIHTGATWRSSAAITRITISPVNGNWRTGSRCSLYGLS